MSSLGEEPRPFTACQFIPVVISMLCAHPQNPVEKGVGGERCGTMNDLKPLESGFFKKNKNNKNKIVRQKNLLQVVHCFVLGERGTNSACKEEKADFPSDRVQTLACWLIVFRASEASRSHFFPSLSNKGLHADISGWTFRTLGYTEGGNNPGGE